MSDPAALRSCGDDYERLRRYLCRLSNWECAATMPAHFYLPMIDERALGAVAVDAVRLIDKMRAGVEALNDR